MTVPHAPNNSCLSAHTLLHQAVRMNGELPTLPPYILQCYEQRQFYLLRDSILPQAERP
jgi:hypothetical protein